MEVGRDFAGGYLLKRMSERRIDAEDIVRVLKSCVLAGTPVMRCEEWRYKVKERRGNASPERQDIEVVVVIVDEEEIEAHTVYRRRRG